MVNAFNSVKCLGLEIYKERLKIAQKQAGEAIVEISKEENLKGKNRK